MNFFLPSAYYTIDSPVRKSRSEMEEKMSLTPLFTLSLDETGIVKSILTDNASPAQQQTIKRLMDLGLIENTKVTCVGVSAFGSPKAFLIRGAVLALRKEEASLILVKKIRDRSVL